jgi:hypothetical protein
MQALKQAERARKAKNAQKKIDDAAKTETAKKAEAKRQAEARQAEADKRQAEAEARQAEAENSAARKRRAEEDMDRVKRGNGSKAARGDGGPTGSLGDLDDLCLSDVASLVGRSVESPSALRARIEREEREAFRWTEREAAVRSDVRERLQREQLLACRDARHESFAPHGPAPVIPAVVPSAARSGESSGDGSSSELHARYGMSPRAFRNEITLLKREHFALSRELREIVDPAARARQAREIASLESRLMERNVLL